jgi:ABC-type phosphate/phosphonate transport system substrate-binding protein
MAERDWNMEMKTTKARLLLTALACILLTHTESARSADQGMPALRIGLSSVVMEADVNTDDALAATRLWASKIGGSSWKTAESTVFADIEKAEELLTKELVDIVAFGSHEYIQHQKQLSAQPFMVYMHNGDVSVEYVLLVRRNSSIESARDLDGKKIAFPNKGRHCLAPIWLDVFLMKSQLPGKEIVLREKRVVNKTNQAILPVFFAQIDGAIVVRSAFETAATLNPQIGKQLKVLATSPQLVPLTVCLRQSLSPNQKTVIIDRALRLHESTEGLQTFTILKIDRIVSWQKSYEVNVRQLVEEYEKLKKTVQ